MPAQEMFAIVERMMHQSSSFMALAPICEGPYLRIFLQKFAEAPWPGLKPRVLPHPHPEQHCSRGMLRCALNIETGSDKTTKFWRRTRRSSSATDLATSCSRSHTPTPETDWVGKNRLPTPSPPSIDRTTYSRSSRCRA